MTAKNYTFTFSIICLLAITACMNSDSKKNQKGSHMSKQGDTLNLKNFTTHPSGLMHEILKEGTGKKPSGGQIVKVHYTGWLLDGKDKVGKKFDSSVDRGQYFEFPVGMGHVIKGWDHTVADMKIGEKRIVIIPASLGYGTRGAGLVIPGNATLIFEIELFDAR